MPGTLTASDARSGEFLRKAGAAGSPTPPNCGKIRCMDKRGAKPSISLAKPGDARAITALRTAVAQHMAQAHGEGHWSAIPTRADVVRQMRASQVLVARLDENIVGTVRLTTINPHSINSAGFTPVSSALYLLGLSVAPDYRRLGVGRALIAATQDMARSRRAEALWLDTYEGPAGAGPFYLRCGFRQVGAAGPASAQRMAPLVYFEWLVD